MHASEAKQNRFSSTVIQHSKSGRFIILLPAYHFTHLLMLYFWQSRPRLLLALLLMGLLLVVFFVVSIPEATHNPLDAYQPGVPHEILGEEESCVSCHGELSGFAPAHSAIGCSPCHLGDPYQEDADEAHHNMVSIPGNLSDVHYTCGTRNCHADLAHRVDSSLMASMAGVLTVNRWAFGESDTLSAWAHVKELSPTSPADTHLRQLCASCHLGNQKEEAKPVGEASRGGGCLACHLSYSPEALAAHQYYHRVGQVGKLKVHPAIDLQVGNDHCFGCHSRSGRISTNFEGWHETKLLPDEVFRKPGYRVLADQRVFEFIEPDVHHTQGLECIDCHTANELMGDGKRYFHEEQAVTAFCGDCHFSTPPALASADALSEEAKKILALRGLSFPEEGFVIGKYSGEPLINVRWEEGEGPYMLSKNSGKQFPLSAPAEVCTKGSAHNALACSACHTSWAPQCVGCHTAFDPKQKGFDLLDHKRVNGKWEEYLGEFFAEPPTLGVVEEMDIDSQLVKKVKAFIPGMIMTFDPSAFPGLGSQQSEIFHRLFAPVAPHTTTSEGRSCKSCHNNPLALGYGRGDLYYEYGKWTFEPEYVASAKDGLPQDAWIRFLQYPSGPVTTRPNARPFHIAEQQRILTVGACLSCHQEDSKVMMDGLVDFQAVLEKVTSECVLPYWE